ncbi:hypothetical protein B0H14DRAFT_3500469 [Mycena olivaceomarginata]|nr:hypothetical protein B0H14DRAFT_3500469 [Mycena olivaceomarginata]
MVEKGEETEWTTRSYTSSGTGTSTLFSNDIQGTGAVVLSGFINAARLSSAASLSSHRILFFGAGSAGVGVAMQLMSFFTLEGVSEQEARERIWLVDSQGLVYTTRGELAEHKEYFARREYAGPPITDLLDILDSVQPTALMGLSTMSGAFSRAAIETRRLERNTRSSFSYGYRSREPSTFYQGQANYSAGYQEQSQGYNQMAQQSFQLYEQSRFSQNAHAGSSTQGGQAHSYMAPTQSHIYTAAQLSTSDVSADVSASAPAIPATGSTTSEPSTGAVHAFNATDTVDQLRANRRHRRQRRQVHDQWTQQSQASQKVATDAAHKPSDPAPSYGMSPFAHNPVAKTQPNLAPNIGAPPAQQPVASSATPAAPSHTAIPDRYVAKGISSTELPRHFPREHMSQEVSLGYPDLQTHEQVWISPVAAFQRLRFQGAARIFVNPRGLNDAFHCYSPILIWVPVRLQRDLSGSSQ